MFKLLFVTTVTVILAFWLKTINLASLFSFQDEINPMALSAEFDEAHTTAVFNNLPVELPQLFADSSKESALKILGESNPEGEKRIAVDLTNQRLLAFEGDEIKYNFLISSGTWGRTPTGTFRIWSKFRYTKMSGGSKQLGTYYYLPNVPFVMFFYNDEVPMSKGYSLHGTYWHDNFGTPMSHGCINMKTEEVEQLFYWAQPELNGQKTMRATKDNPGTKIVIYGKAPS